MNILELVEKNQVLVGLVITWLVYRFGVYSERKNIIESVKKEIELHSLWVATPYKSSDISDLRYKVIKVSTTAIENAIVKGPSIFLNHDLIDALVDYNQSIYRFNQTIESVNDFGSNIELWDGEPSVMDTPGKKRMKKLIEAVHTEGIGDEQSQGAAHINFLQLQKEIKKEHETVLFLLVWLLSNLNLFWVKKYIIKLL